MTKKQIRSLICPPIIIFFLNGYNFPENHDQNWKFSYHLLLYFKTKFVDFDNIVNKLHQMGTTAFKPQKGKKKNHHKVCHMIALGEKNFMQIFTEYIDTLSWSWKSR